MMQQPALLARAANPVIEGVEVGPARCHQAAENTVLAEHREHLAGHVRGKAGDGVVVHERMLAVRPREANRCRAPR